MNGKNTVNLVDVIIDEVALEGLDGITLEALWQRLSVRLEEPLPFKRGFMEQIWGICLEVYDFSFFELDKPRGNLVVFDRYELEYLNSDSEKNCDQDIYEVFPIEDTNLGVRGSCASYHTRKNVKDDVRGSSLSDAEAKYGQRLVIVASQGLRERALIEDSVSPNIQLSIQQYVLLERIGRTRYLGDVTIKKYGDSGMKEDAKTLFYWRKGLLENGLIRRQVYYQGNRGLAYAGQNVGTLIHLTRFFNTRKPKVIAWAERLIDYLKSKENYAAEYNEVKNLLNLDYSIKKFFKISVLQKVFRTDLKVPYRSYFPNSLEKEWQTKSCARERIVKLVALIDPSIKISDLWRSEEVKEAEDDNRWILDTKNQKLNVPFLRQAYDIVEASECKGVSQMELATQLGLTKLTSRTLVRNLSKTRVVSTFIDDIGRQRTTKFVSRKWDEKNDFKKQMEEEISKIKAYSSSVKVDRIKGNARSSQVNNDDDDDDDSVPMRMDSSGTPFSINQTDSRDDSQFKCDSCQSNLFSAANQILRKYKLFNNKINRYYYTSTENRIKYPGMKRKRIGIVEKQSQGDKSSGVIDSRNKPDVIDSDFYKMIETRLIVQKPECKKKSQRIAVVGIMENLDSPDMSLNVSFRLVHRANMVIECVKQHKVIEDTRKLMKYINDEETKEGLDIKCDKNSLIRLLQKMSEDKLIKNIKLVMKSKKRTKEINFICDPSVEVDDPLIQSAVEQAKLKFCMPAAYSFNSLIRNEKITGFGRVAPVYGKFQSMSPGIPFISRNSTIARSYGYSTKFLRLKYLHLFLFHLIYDHPEKIVPTSVLLENSEQEETTTDAESALENFSHVYWKTIDWRMFIPPLPRHLDYPLGWALMADLHLRMPLSLFVKVINVNYEVPGLRDFLDHPIKRHYLVKDLPTPIINLLFYKRKYIFSIHELVTRLCYLGLVQFGPQRLKEKDHVFIYLNRNAELLDTTSSSPGYHRVEDKPYPATKFVFTSTPVVENYWYEMWNICINTCLGGRLVVEGKDILLEDLSRKPEMVQATKVRSPEEASRHDVGFVPGDRKGAAGIDSAFFAHLKRNWNWLSSDTQVAGIPGTRIDKSERAKKINQFRRRSGLSPKSLARSINAGGRPASKPKLGKLAAPVFPQAKCSKPSKIIRKVLPRKQKRKRVKYDEIDFSALQRMDKLRVDWEQHEDNILLVCKVAMMYLSPNPRRNIISFAAIRDVLRDYSFTSLNKTSRACQRRLLYMLKQPKTHNSVLLGVEEVKQDFYVNKRFGGIVDKLRAESENVGDCEPQVEKVFKELVSYIARKYYNIANMEYREPIALPKTIQEFNLFYQLKLPARTIKSPGISKEVHEVNDIHTCTINSVIHSSMCCGKERRSWAYQLFKVYQQYPEYLLRNAMLKIRGDKMVTMKKSYMCANKKFGNCMPMSSSQYQLSSCYFYKFQTKWPYQLFSETYNILLTLLENHVERKAMGAELVDGVEVKPDGGGIVAALHDYLSTDILDVDIDIPEQVIMLDPGLPQKNEIYQRIAVRYQAILDAFGIGNAKDSSQDQVLRDSQSTDDHLFKRPLEDDNEDSFSSRTKKARLDGDERNDAQSVDGEIRDILGDGVRKVEVPSSNDSNKDAEYRPDSASTSFSLQNFSCDWLDGFQNAVPSNLSTENVQRHVQFSGDPSENCPNASEDCNDPTSLSMLPPSNASLCGSENTRASASTRVSQLVRRAKSDANSMMIENLETRNDVQDARTKQTRIAMLQMREELQDLSLDDNHHAHEYFVVNSFKLIYSLVSSEEDERETVLYQGMELPKKLLPVDIRLVDEILDGIKNHAVFPKETPTLDELKSQIKLVDLSFQWENVEVVSKFIKSKAEFGATLHELVIKFDHLGDKLAEVLTFLIEKRVVLRAGIVTVRYIHHRYINPWIIHSYKILRLEKEAHQTVPEGSVYLLDAEENSPDKNQERNRVYNATNLFYAPPLKSLSKDRKNSDTANETARDSDAISDKSVCNKRKIDEDGSIHESKKPKTVSETNADSKMNDTYATERKENLDESNDSVEPKGTSATSVTPDQTKLNTQADEISPSVNKESKDMNDEKTKEISDNVSESSEGQSRLRRKRTIFLKQKDVYRAAKLLDFNTAEEIKVVIKPWIRIDGVLNRRVLDRMLGAVLCYCIERPGLSLTAVQNRFSPAIQPYHTRELIEILAKLGCVKTTVQKVPKVTLFSKPGKIDFTGNPNLVANSDNYIVEPTTQCALKFGMFLSNRSYNSDFLSSL